MHNRLAGVIPAAVVPMDRNFVIDLSAYRHYLGWLVGTGPVGVAVNVDTGENMLLSEQERHDIVSVARETLGAATLVAGVSGPGTAMACRNARSAAQAGADALLVFPSPAFLSRPVDSRVVLDFHQAIADASGLPLIAFNLAAEFGGTPYSNDTLRELLTLPAVVALKEASFDARRFREVVELVEDLADDVVLLNGNDTFILEATLLGAHGCLLGYGSVASDLLVDVERAWHDGDVTRTRAAGRRAQQFCDYIYGRPMGDYRARSKVALVHRDIFDPDVTFVRPPYLSLWETSEREAALDAVVSAGLSAA